MCQFFLYLLISSRVFRAVLIVRSLNLHRDLIRGPLSTRGTWSPPFPPMGSNKRPSLSRLKQKISFLEACFLLCLWFLKFIARKHGTESSIGEDVCGDFSTLFGTWCFHKIPPMQSLVLGVGRGIRECWNLTRVGCKGGVLVSCGWIRYYLDLGWMLTPAFDAS